MAEHTPPELRTQSMSSLAGAFGLGTVIGPFLAPLFVLPFVGLAGPMLGFAAMAGLMLFVVWKMLPESQHMPAAPVRAEIAKDAKGGDATKEKPMWRDPRVTPFLIYGFIVAVCQTAQAQTLGFLIIDKLGLDPMKAQGYIAIAMMFGAMAGLLAQWGIIRMFEMTPRQLLRWGVGVAAVGNVIVALQPTYAAVVAGFAISSLGFGLARPGFTAGASLAVDMHEQARVAGAIAAVNGVNVVLAETLGSCGAHYATPTHLRAVGLSIDASHLKTATSGWVTGVTRPLKNDAAGQVWQIDITDDAGDLVCVSKITMALLNARPHK
ncbi:MAG: MFS transporter [Comamonadaceae bacterium]|nr:MAG: MFS transporter [Comamonadaceae bacterium]